MSHPSGQETEPQAVPLAEAIQKRPGMPPEMLLRMLVEHILKDPAAGSLEATALEIRRQLDSAPRWPVQIADWSRGRLLEGTPYVGEPIFDGSVGDAFRIARDLFLRGLHVMLKRIPETGGIVIWVDDGNFRQR